MEMKLRRNVHARCHRSEVFPDRRLTIGRTAILTQAHRGPRCPAITVDHAPRGCITRSYFSSLHSTLPAAEATGKTDHASIQRRFIASSSTRKTRRITGVRVIDGQTKQTVEFHAKVIFSLRLNTGGRLAS